MNLWILTEERPREVTLGRIIEEASKELKIDIEIKKIIINPIIINKKFTFLHEIEGAKSSKVEHFYIKLVQGSKSFIDFLVFYMKNEPTPSDTPLIAVEETKVDIEESRNVTAYQRNTKFVYIPYFFKDIKKLIIFFRDFPSHKLNKTYSLRFGLRLLMTIGVEIWGIENLKDYGLTPFQSVDDFIDYKNNMPAPRSGQQVKIVKLDDEIKISAKLDKGSGSAKNKISHDPNIGQVSSIVRCLRVLGWRGKITISDHNVTQKNIDNAKNKLIPILVNEEASLENINLPQEKNLPPEYWKKSFISEKNSTIFLDILLSQVKNVEVIFNHHAGCERGYFKTPKGESLALPKTDFPIPDLIVCDHARKEIINVEGKTHDKVLEGISKLKNFDKIEAECIKKYYPNYRIIRCVALFGGKSETISHDGVAFLLNESGEIIVSDMAPEAIKIATKDFSQKSTVGDLTQFI